MTPETVLRMIRDYKACAAKAVQLEGEIEILKMQAEKAMENEMAESALHGANMDGMPHSTGPGDPTGSHVARFLDGYKPLYLRDLDADIEGREKRVRELRVVCRLVEGWMQVLPERERFVIQRHMILGDYWGEVIRLYSQRWGQIGKDALKKVQKQALERIYAVAK